MLCWGRVRSTPTTISHLPTSNPFSLGSRPDDTLEHLGYVGADTSMENVQRQGQDKNYAGIITALACGEDDDYIYIGGLFQNVSNTKPYDISDDEWARGVVKVKDLGNRTEDEVKIEDVAEKLKALGAVPAGCEFAVESGDFVAGMAAMKVE